MKKSKELKEINDRVLERLSKYVYYDEKGEMHLTTKAYEKELNDLIVRIDKVTKEATEAVEVYKEYLMLQNLT